MASTSTDRSQRNHAEENLEAARQGLLPDFFHRQRQRQRQRKRQRQRQLMLPPRTKKKRTLVMLRGLLLVVLFYVYLLALSENAFYHSSRTTMVTTSQSIVKSSITHYPSFAFTTPSSSQSPSKPIQTQWQADSQTSAEASKDNSSCPNPQPPSLAPLVSSAYELSYVCPGCRRAKVDRATTCGFKVDKELQKMLKRINTTKRGNPCIGNSHNNITSTTELAYWSTHEQLHNHIALAQFRAYLYISKLYDGKCRLCNPFLCYRRHRSTLDHNDSHKTGIQSNKTNTAAAVDSLPLSPRNRYWHFNHTYPRYTSAVTPGPLTCIPVDSRYQYNYSSVQELEASSFNVTQFMHDRWNQKGTEDKQQEGPKVGRTDIFVEYNPTVTQLPQSLQVQFNSWEKDNHDRDNPIVYLASYRVTSWQGCFPWTNVVEHFPREQVELMKNQHNYLGLSLLRADLSTVPGSEIVLDLETELERRRIHKRPPRRIKNFVDYRLYIFSNQLYLNINGPPVYLVPIHIELRPTPPTANTTTTILRQHKYHPNHASTTSDNQSNHSSDQVYRNVPANMFLIPNKYGDSMTLFVGTTVYHISDDGGKNFALFQPDALAETTGGIVVEHNIHEPRRVQTIQLSQQQQQQPPLSKTHTAEPQTVQRKPLITRISLIPAPNTTDILEDNLDNRQMEMIAPPSFATVDELWFSEPVFNTNSHGGACCVKVPLPDSLEQTLSSRRDKIITDVGKSTSTSTGISHDNDKNNKNKNNNSNHTNHHVWVGIGHTKIPYLPRMQRPENINQAKDKPHHQYVSFLYALNPYEPPMYPLVARSGYFCLPLADMAHEEMTNARILWTRQRTLNLKQYHFANCPEISFVSGIVQHATNDHQVIVSYGINDCTSRMIVIDKEELYRLLFHGLEEEEEEDDKEQE